MTAMTYTKNIRSEQGENYMTSQHWSFDDSTQTNTSQTYMFFWVTNTPKLHTGQLFLRLRIGELHAAAKRIQTRLQLWSQNVSHPMLVAGMQPVLGLYLIKKCILPKSFLDANAALFFPSQDQAPKVQVKHLGQVN